MYIPKNNITKGRYMTKNYNATESIATTLGTDSHNKKNIAMRV